MQSHTDTNCNCCYLIQSERASTTFTQVGMCTSRQIRTFIFKGVSLSSFFAKHKMSYTIVIIINLPYQKMKVPFHLKLIAFKTNKFYFTAVHWYFPWITPPLISNNLSKYKRQTIRLDKHRSQGSQEKCQWMNVYLLRIVLYEHVVVRCVCPSAPPDK